MRTNNVILLTILAIFIIAIGIMAGMSLTNNNNNTNTSNITNNTTNITLNETNNTTNETAKTTTKTTTKNNQKKSSDKEYGDYINDEWVSMSEKEYAERYPALYHEESLQKGKYDKYHPEFYEVDRENGRI